ncbi:cytochrome P450 [Geodermatophilus sp. SYSU D00742]
MTRADASPFEGSFWRDPYPAYERLRTQAPVREVALPRGGTTWMITRYDDVRAAFTDPRLVKDHRATLPPEVRAQAPRLPSPFGSMMILLDPPDHTRLRRLVSRAFTPRRTAELRPRIEALAAGLLDALPEGAVDLLATYAVPLPMAVICELLGVPDTDRDAFGAWSRALVDDHDDADEQRATAGLAEYLSALVETKRHSPDGALLSALVEVSEAGDQLSTEEVVAMGVLLLIAGHETTANLIGNAVLGVVTDAALREHLLDDPQRIPAAVEEFLRWDGPVHNAPLRFAAEDVEYSGTTIPAGSVVTLSVGAANRDPGRFDRPELLDPDRDTGGHLAFGHGVHFCLGAPLARLEAEVALRSLLGRFPGLRLAVPPEDLRHRRSVIVHGLERLPVLLQ